MLRPPGQRSRAAELSGTAPSTNPAQFLPCSCPVHLPSSGTVVHGQCSAPPLFHRSRPRPGCTAAPGPRRLCLVASWPVPRCLTALTAHRGPLELFSPVTTAQALWYPSSLSCSHPLSSYGYADGVQLVPSPVIPAPGQLPPRQWQGETPLPFPIHMPRLSGYAATTVARSSSSSLCSCRLSRDTTLPLFFVPSLPCVRSHCCTDGAGLPHFTSFKSLA